MEEEREGERDGRGEREREILWVSTQTSVYSLLCNYQIL